MSPSPQAVTGVVIAGVLALAATVALLFSVLAHRVWLEDGTDAPERDSAREVSDEHKDFIHEELERAEDFILDALGEVERMQRELEEDDTLSRADRDERHERIREHVEQIDLRVQEALYSMTTPVDFAKIDYPHQLPDAYRRYYRGVHGKWMERINSGPTLPRILAARELKRSLTWHNVEHFFRLPRAPYS